MQKHFELSDTEFEKKFANCTLNPTLFSHQAHLRLAWIHINNHGVDTAVNTVKNQIKNFVKSLGAEDKYNETVTIAGVRAINHFVQKSDSSDFANFIKENKQLEDNFKGLLLSHYKTNIFESEIAKKEYLEPDLQAF